MKTIYRAALVCAAAAVAAMTATSCEMLGSGDDNEGSVSIVGRWEAVSETYEGETYTYDPGETEFEFTKDGIFRVYEEGAMVGYVSYTYDRSAKTVTISDGVNSGEMEVRKLTKTALVLYITDDGDSGTITFKRVSGSGDDDDDDDGGGSSSANSKFFGTWDNQAYEGEEYYNILTISASKFSLWMETGKHGYTLENVKWSAAPKNSTNSNFPTGYTLTGKVTAKQGSYGPSNPDGSANIPGVGQQGMIFVYLSKDGKTIRPGSPSISYNNDYKKQ